MKNTQMKSWITGANFIEDNEDSDDSDSGCRGYMRRTMDFVNVLRMVHLEPLEAEKPRKRRKYYIQEDPHTSSIHNFVNNPSVREESSKYGKLFRRRCSLPYSMFKKLCDKIRVEDWPLSFKHVKGTSEKPIGVGGRKMASLEVKVFSALQTLTRGEVFDTSEQKNFVSAEANRVFFIEFVRQIRIRLGKQYIRFPSTVEEINKTTSYYAKLGLPGCIGSLDCVHIHWGMCPISSKNKATGKEGFPSLVYSVTCNRLGFISSIAGSFWGSENDKFIVKIDDNITQVVEEDLYRNYEYELREQNGLLKTVRGNYFICDGGFLNWRILMCGTNCTADYDLAYWSKYIGSVRKDIECTFGRLKKRYSILWDRLNLCRLITFLYLLLTKILFNVNFKNIYFVIVIDKEFDIVTARAIIALGGAVSSPFWSKNGSLE